MQSEDFFVRKKIVGSITYESLEQLREDEFRVGVNIGYYYSPILKDAGVDVVEHPTLEESYQALIDGSIDMYLIEKAVGLSVLKKMGLSDQVVFLPKPWNSSPTYMPFAKKSNYPNLLLLIEQFNKEVRSMHESGEFDKIYDSYVDK